MNGTSIGLRLKWGSGCVYIVENNPEAIRNRDRYGGTMWTMCLKVASPTGNVMPC